MKNHHFQLFFFLLIPCTLFLTPIHAQTWQPVGGYGTDWPDSLTNSLYDYTSGRISQPVNALCVYNNKLYAAGSFIKVAKLKANHIACWDGKKWDTLTSGTDGKVRALTVYRNMLCVGGCFFKAGRKIVNSVAFWIDTANTVNGWRLASDGFKREVAGIHISYEKGVSGKEELESDKVYDLCVYNDTLYACGWLGIGKVAKWKPVRGWRGISDKIMMLIDGKEEMHEPGIPASMQPYKNKLYLGNDPTFSGSNKMQAWNDTIYREVKDDGRIFGQVFAVVDSLLYASRWDRDGTFGFSAWDGKQWSMLYKTKANAPILSMIKYRNRLYIGGGFDSINGKKIRGVAVWSGQDWESVGEGLSVSDKLHGVVTSLCEYKGDLYAAGMFYRSGKTPLQNIARLSFNGQKVPPKRKVK